MKRRIFWKSILVAVITFVCGLVLMTELHQDLWPLLTLVSLIMSIIAGVGMRWTLIHEHDYD